MLSKEKTDHNLICLFGDDKERRLEKFVSEALPHKDIKILKPATEENLLQAAANCSLVVIAVTGLHNLGYVRKMKENRKIVADIVGLAVSPVEEHELNFFINGFDFVLDYNTCDQVKFGKFLHQRTIMGGRRLNSFLIEEEFRRFSDALSSAPTSVIVFDNEKRIVFVSEHYFRAYPKSAPRLIRGLNVYDAFEMMSQEESIDKKDPRYDDIRNFWYRLQGEIEFTLDNGVSYRLKASTLPNQRGTIVTAQNITDRVKIKEKLGKALERIQQLENPSEN